MTTNYNVSSGREFNLTFRFSVDILCAMSMEQIHNEFQNKKSSLAHADLFYFLLTIKIQTRCKNANGSIFDTVFAVDYITVICNVSKNKCSVCL